MATEIIEVDLEREALSWPRHAKEIQIRDQAAYTRAGSLLVDISALEAQIQRHHKPIKETAFAAHKAAVAAEKRLLDPLLEAKAILKRGIAEWEIEQERVRQEAEREARAEAARLEQDLRLQQAVLAEEQGATPDAVAEVLETPIPIPAPVITATFERVRGVGTQQRWKAQVVDIRALCRAVAEGRLAETYVEPNMAALNSRARAEKSAMNIPGVKAVPETTVTVRRS
jgi:hypothetical protein